jgi:molybdopterin-guanine dinucleotide biosynthesis protein A
MIKLDRMLMIGSAGANVGKTELACAIIKRFSNEQKITGVKVTTIKEKDGQCPRGGEGCGVCTSLDGNFLITEETNRSSGKDTARLLAAGASRVFWLRVMKTHLEEGIRSLLEVVGRQENLICESNSLREVVEPGLFFMVVRDDLEVWKSSAENVRKYADRTVISDGRGFDFDIGRINIVKGRWVVKEDATAIIMAGGNSSRMGVDKSMLPIGGRPIVERVYEQLFSSFKQILISSNNKGKLGFLGAEVVPDKITGQGPLMGIASALEASENEINFVVACDIPDIKMTFVRRMLCEAQKADIVIPTTADDKIEPLFAVYRKSVLGAINEVLSSGGRKISDIFAKCRVKYIELDENSRLLNINTQKEYEEFKKRYEDGYI